MAKDNTTDPNVSPEPPKTVEVPLELLTQMQEQIATLEKNDVDKDAKIAGLEQINATADTTDTPRLRERKNFEPKFRTVRLRKYPKGESDEMEYVSGWTNKGAYQLVDRTGVSPQIVDYIDILFLGDEKTEDGKIKAQQVKLLDFLNKGQQVHCKVIEMRRRDIPVPTNEEISVVTFDQQHGMMSTGETIDGYMIQSDIQVLVNVPGHGEVLIDGEFVNQ